MSRSRTTLVSTVFACMGFVVISGCDSPSGPGDPDLRGGIVATFEVSGEPFRVWITNPATIADVLALEAGESDANIPSGRIHRGSGQAGHNAPYSWHLDPEEIEMAELAAEVCDGHPAYIEDHVDEFVDNVGRFCPWTAELAHIEDHR